jgi:hypothetical protein
MVLSAPKAFRPCFLHVTFTHLDSICMVSFTCRVGYDGDIYPAFFWDLRFLWLFHLLLLGTFTLKKERIMS